jgi:hypothetical protein
MSIREEFEAWHKKEVAAFMGAGLTKAAQHMQDFKETMAAVWEASREAMVVEWPNHYDYTNSDVAGAAILDCRTAFGKAVKL